MGSSLAFNTKVSQSGSEVYAASSSGNDTYAVTLAPVPAAYVNGLVVNFKPDTANTGAATLNVNGLGAIAITKNNDVALATGDIEANQIVTVVYNSTGPTFNMQSQVAAASASGGMTLISTQTASASATLDWTGLSAGYKLYQMIITNLIPNGAATTFRLLLGTGAGPTFGYQHRFCTTYVSSSSGTSVEDGKGTGTDKIQLVSNLGGLTIQGNILFCDLSSAADSKYVRSLYLSIGAGSGTHANYYTVNGELVDSNPVTAIRLELNASTFTSGSVSLYGIN